MRRDAALLREINALFPGGAPAADEGDRSRQLAQLPERAGALAAELERVVTASNVAAGGKVLLTRLYDFYFA